MDSPQLTIHNHDRDSVGYAYVYPVVSRRAGGVSVGINLNPNNACNWACIYCQVPNLIRGNAPVINMAQLEQELRDFLTQAVHGDWLAQHVPAEVRVLQDIAISGNGEPTSAQEFPQVVELAGSMLREFGLDKVKLRLITNGSLMSRASVQGAIRTMGAMNGEVWFKLDRATAEGMATVNQINDHMDAVRKRLLACADGCTTWLQTCWFARDGLAPAQGERLAYVDFVRGVSAHLAGVHLYGLARQPMQPGSERLSALSMETLEAFAQEIRALKLTVTVNE